MKKLILVASDAPLSGKTTFVRVLEQYYERKGVGSISIYTSAAAAPDETAFWDLEEDPEPKRLLKALDDNDAVILAVGTGHSQLVMEMFADFNLHDSILEYDAELCLATAINGTKTAAESVASLGEAFADNADYILLSMPFAPEDEKEAEWEGSYGDKVMSYLGATLVDVPEFDPGMGAELEGHGMDLPRALARRKELPRFLRDAVHSWELSFCDALGSADAQLVPETTGSRSAYDNSSVEY